MFFEVKYVHVIRLVCLSGFCLAARSCSDFDMPDLNKEVYIIDGDVNIGALYSITDYGEGLKCTKKLRPEAWVQQFVEATVFAVQLVNSDARLLPGLKLGLVMLDYCRTTNVALAKALSFLPRSKVDSCGGGGEGVLAFSPSPNASSTEHYDVVGVIGTFSSPATVYVSYLYAVAKMPLLSFIATSDELSDKYQHPYFLRVVPPDKFQVLAMLQFISNNSWSFISILYEKGSYGEKAFDNFKLYASRFGICFAVSLMVDASIDFDQVVKSLLDFPRARAVVLFTSANVAANVLKASTRRTSPGHFIWIGSDGLSDKLIYRRDLASELVGAFVFMFYSKEVPRFSDYFRNLNVNDSANPWFRQYWEMQGKCSFENDTCGVYKSPAEFSGFKFSTTVSLILDSVWTYANALHRLIEDVCPNLSKNETKNCIQRPKLLQYLLNSSFEGFTGHIQFNSEGDVLGKYEIRQVTVTGLPEGQVISESSSEGSMVEIPIATYDITYRLIVYNNNSVSWGHLALEERIINRSESDPLSFIPESVCSRPCLADEYRIQKEISCCWDCGTCRENEKIVNNGTGCETCPEMTWPDLNLTTCSPIPPGYSSPTDTLSLIEICLSVIAIVCEGLVVAAYVVHRNSRVIKASSRELSALQLLGIFSGYVTVIVFQIKPSHEACNAIYFVFCSSFAWLYSPLLVKAIRIWRIFESSAKFNLRPRFVSPKSQIIFVFILIFIQFIMTSCFLWFIGIEDNKLLGKQQPVINLVICVFIYVFYTPTMRKSQPLLTEKYVELSCDMTLPGLVSFLAYNLLLVTLCSVFAFKTRKLPENFNESRFISMCVSTALIIWLSFIATYFTATKEEVRVLLLSMTLLINHTVALVFLFLPKIYAAVYVDSSGITTQGRVSTIINHNGNSFMTPYPVTPLSISNRVSPAPGFSADSQSVT